MTYPIAHLNGTSLRELIIQRQEVVMALINALDAMKTAGPHPRDYYHTPESRFTAAQEVHQMRLEAVDNLIQSFELELEGLYKQESK